MDRGINDQHGAFVVSLDFELHWGVRDRQAADGPYRVNLAGARQAIPHILRLFEEFDIAATWATVGFLFATSRRELLEHYPYCRPTYRVRALDPYLETIGENEQEDELHYASSLIELIRGSRRQEIATHTFSHFCCLEPYQNQEAFKADLESAVRLAAKRRIRLRSIVFPRNQVKEEYLDLLAAYGITSYRGTERGWMYNARCREEDGTLRRGARLADQIIPVSGSRVTPWRDIYESRGLSNVRGSMFLRPYSPKWHLYDSLRLRRISTSIRLAATKGGIFHLWWHPHNFGLYTHENLNLLRRVLEVVAECKERYGLQTMSMSEVANQVGRGEASNISPAFCS
jgi:peptidoglycan/xylan/chitin deacetylase (PgdA/CDA1 family)